MCGCVRRAAVGEHWGVSRPRHTIHQMIDTMKAQRKDHAMTLRIVKAALRQPRDVAQIAAVTGLKKHRVYDAIERMRKEGLVEPAESLVTMRTYRAWRLKEAAL